MTPNKRQHTTFRCWTRKSCSPFRPVLGIYKDVTMKIVLITFILCLTGCSSIPLAKQHIKKPIYSDTMEIIRSAAEAAPESVDGEYILHIKTADSQGDFVYLNTELDYRDQRSVTVSIHPSVIPQFEAKYGRHLQQFFLNKSISVTGQAKRITITLNFQGKSTGKYYYQTHIRVIDIAQIKVLAEHA